MAVLASWEKPGFDVLGLFRCGHGIPLPYNEVVLQMCGVCCLMHCSVFFNGLALGHHDSLIFGLAQLFICCYALLKRPNARADVGLAVVHHYRFEGSPKRQNVVVDWKP